MQHMNAMNVVGRLVTGDCRKDIHLWEMKQGGTWDVDQRPFSAHTASVEDLQWSPTEQTVTCNVLTHGLLGLFEC